MANQYKYYNSRSYSGHLEVFLISRMDQWVNPKKKLNLTQVLDS